jgi:hypothetical protein
MTSEREAELHEMLKAMQNTNEEFYLRARAIGFHEYLEVAGILTEISKIARRAYAEKKDFVADGLELDETSAAYIGEKIGCIFHRALYEDSQRLIGALMRGALKSAGCPAEILDAVFPRSKAKVRVVDAAEITGHPTMSLLARDYVGGETRGEQEEAD